MRAYACACVLPLFAHRGGRLSWGRPGPHLRMPRAPWTDGGQAVQSVPVNGAEFVLTETPQTRAQVRSQLPHMRPSTRGHRHVPCTHDTGPHMTQATPHPGQGRRLRSCTCCLLGLPEGMPQVDGGLGAWGLLVPSPGSGRPNPGAGQAGLPRSLSLVGRQSPAPVLVWLPLCGVSWSCSHFLQGCQSCGVRPQSRDLL